MDFGNQPTAVAKSFVFCGGKIRSFQERNCERAVSVGQMFVEWSGLTLAENFKYVNKTC